MNETVAQEYEEYQKAGRIWGKVPMERFSKIRFPRPSGEIIQQYLQIKDLVSNVSDILDSLGLRGCVAASHLHPVVPGKRIVGPAVTVRSIPERKTPTQGYIAKDTIRMSTRDIYYIAEPGDVFVADFGGNPDVSNMGGQSCTVAMSCGVIGAIVNGAVRDVPSIRELDYPVWARGATPMTGKFRMEAIEINGPVTLYDIAIYPGDLIVADDSGVCAIPPDQVDHVLSKLQSIDQEEAVMRGLVNAKRPIDEIRPLYRKRYS
jgi:4-hydroxy-4-methyl-2-oxoglutarate aldolase